MERKPEMHRPSPTGEYFGLFVRGKGEARNGSWRVTDALILHGPLYTSPAMRSDLEADALRRRIRGQDAEVITVKRGTIIVVREIPESSVTSIIVD